MSEIVIKFRTITSTHSLDVIQSSMSAIEIKFRTTSTHSLDVISSMSGIEIKLRTTTSTHCLHVISGQHVRN
jgi:hypothetical protein